MNRSQSAPVLMRTLFNGWEPSGSILRAEVMVRQPHVHWFTKEVDDRVVSSVTLYTVNLLSRRLAVIEEVVTLPEYRNRGFATALIREAIDRAIADGADCVELCVRADDAKTRSFYESMGFRDRNQTVMRLTCDAAR